MACECQREIISIHDARRHGRLEDAAVFLYVRWFSYCFKETDIEDMTAVCQHCGAVHELAPRFRPGNKYRFSREKFLEYNPKYDNELYDEIMSKHYGRRFTVADVRLHHKLGKGRNQIIVVPEHCDLIE